MNENKNYISLNFYDFDCDLSVVTGLLQLTPTEQGTRGRAISKSGPPLKFHFWCYREEFESNMFIGELVESFCERIIRPIKEQIRTVADLGFAELQIVQYYYDGYNPGYHFSNKMLGLIHEIGVAIDIDLYCLANTE